MVCTNTCRSFTELKVICTALVLLIYTTTIQKIRSTFKILYCLNYTKRFQCLGRLFNTLPTIKLWCIPFKPTINCKQLSCAHIHIWLYYYLWCKSKRYYTAWWRRIMDQCTFRYLFPCGYNFITITKYFKLF